MRQHELAWVGLGANVGSARQALERAVEALSGLPSTSLAGVSRLYRTRPVGPVAQADFHNAAVALRVPAGASPEAGAMALLLSLKALERTLGRVERERWGPREIDLDLLLFGDHALRVEREATARSHDPLRPGTQWLEVPHPSARERSFVLAPLADLAPDLEPPGWGETVAAARARAAAGEGPDAVTPVGQWDDRTRRWRDLPPSAQGPSGSHGRSQDTRERHMPSPHMPTTPPRLIDRFRMILERFPELERRKVFGYPAAFVAAGHMVTSLHGSSWIVRLGEDDQALLRGAGGADFEPMPGRPMTGFLRLPDDIVADDEAVATWIGKARAHASTLPPKQPKKATRRKT